MGIFGGGGGGEGAAKLSKLSVQDVGYGTPIKICYGTNRVAVLLGTVVDFKAEEHEQGGKGGGGEGGKYYTYSATVMFFIGEGAIKRFGKVWRDKKKFDTLANAGFTFSKTGTALQTVWGTFGTKPEALPYSATALFAGAAYDLGQNASVGNHSVEISGVALSATSTDQNYTNCHIKDVIYDFLGNAQYGAVDPNTAVITLQMASTHDYCMARGLLISPLIEEKKPAHEYLTEWATVANAGIVWSEGKLKLIPYADEFFSSTYGVYDPVTTIRYAFNDDNLEEPISPERKKPADCYNKVTIECINPDKDYAKFPVEASDQAAIEQYGLRPAETSTMTSITSTTVAKIVAHTQLQRGLYIRNTYTLKTWCDYDLLEPLDFISITDAALGLNAARCRVVSLSDEQDGRLTIVAEEAPIGVYCG